MMLQTVSDLSLNRNKVFRITYKLLRAETISAHLMFGLVLRDQIEDLAQGITRGEMTVAQAASKVTDRHGNLLNPSESTFRNYCKANQIEFSGKSGRPRRKIPEEIVDYVTKKHCEFGDGVNGMYERCVQDGYDASHRMDNTIYDELGFYHHKKKPLPIPKYRCRYEADQRDLIWHADIHYWDHDPTGRKYLLAFIDDASRKIMGYSMLDDKSSKSAATALQRVLATEQKPYTIWTDNGGEFDGDFKKEMALQDINVTRSAPYNPQQNGKIERFWQTAEKASSEADLEKQISDYNAHPHSALAKVKYGERLIHESPNKAWERMRSWSESERTWTVDGVRKAFKADDK
jgi:hypothetical protein